MRHLVEQPSERVVGVVGLLYVLAEFRERRELRALRVDENQIRLSLYGHYGRFEEFRFSGARASDYEQVRSVRITEVGNVPDASDLHSDRNREYAFGLELLLQLDELALVTRDFDSDERRSENRSEDADALDSERLADFSVLRGDFLHARTAPRSE